MDVPREDTRKYGIVAGSPAGERLLKVTDIDGESPSPKGLPATPRSLASIFTPAIFEELEKTGKDASGDPAHQPSAPCSRRASLLIVSRKAMTPETRLGYPGHRGDGPHAAGPEGALRGVPQEVVGEMGK